MKRGIIFSLVLALCFGVFAAATTQAAVPGRDVHCTTCDVNRDGKVDFEDARAVLSRVQQAKPYSARYDVNGDKAVDYRDAVLIIEFVAGVSPTPTPAPTATATPAGAITAFDYGDTPRQFDTVFARVKALAAQAPNLPACDESDPRIHPRDQWHGLVYFEPAADVSAIKLVCHFSHEHGQDPNQLNYIFGKPGAWFGPSQSISSPAQTFFVPATITSTTITTAQLQALGVPVLMENDVKHEGYRWFTFAGSDCSATDLAAFKGRNCVVAARVQLHIHNTLDFHIRFHSFTLEFAVRGDANDPGTQGIVRSMGWADHSALITPALGSRCFMEFNRDPQTNLIPLPGDRQYFPLPTDAGQDVRPFDEFRCHQQVPLQYVIQNQSGVQPAVVEQMPFEWWLHTGDDLRVQVMVANPVAGPTTSGAADLPYCQQAANAAPQTTGTCRWSGGRAHFNSGYILPIIYDTYYLKGRTVDLRDDPDGDGILSGQYWLTRWGDKAEGCKAVSLDCLPRRWEGRAPIPTYQGKSIQGYKDIRPTDFGRVVPFDGDITPLGTRTWVAAAWSGTKKIAPVLPDVQELHNH